MLVSMDKKYTTNDGKQVRIYSVDGGGRFPIHGATRKFGEEWVPSSWTPNGKISLSSDSYELDLVEVWEPVDKEPIWCFKMGDPTYLAVRHLRFYDAENKGVFKVDGSRGGPIDFTYHKVECVEPWMVEVQNKLEE